GAGGAGFLSPVVHRLELLGLVAARGMLRARLRIGMALAEEEATAYGRLHPRHALDRSRPRGLAARRSSCDAGGEAERRSASLVSSVRRNRGSAGARIGEVLSSARRRSGWFADVAGNPRRRRIGRARFGGDG